MVGRSAKVRTRRWLRDLSQFSITKASQLREKSNQWFRETEFLFRNERRAAFVYLGGFVIECLLKYALWPQRHRPEIRKLLWGSHDLDKLLAACGALERELSKPPWDGVRESFEFLKSWSVRIRYNPKCPSAHDVRDYRRRLSEVRQWLLGRI